MGRPIENRGSREADEVRCRPAPGVARVASRRALAGLRRGRRHGAALLGVAATLASSLACSPASRHRVAAVLFDGVPAAGERNAAPPRRKVREDLARENEELRRALLAAQEALRAKEGPPREATPIAEKAATWAEARALLPAVSTGIANWETAVEKGLVAPRPGLDPRTAVQAVLDLEVEVANVVPAGSAFAVTFSHAPHTRWLSCNNCHPALYPFGRKAAPAAVRMKAMQEGKSCGACHGPVAFGITACVRCHPKNPARLDWKPREPPRKPVEAARTWADAAKLLPAKGGAPDWTAALASGVIAPRAGVAAGAKPEDTDDAVVELVPAGDEASKAIFPHLVHTQLLQCDSCHPALFEMEKGATKMSMETIDKGQHCGACHGKVGFPADACGRCHPAM